MNRPSLLLHCQHSLGMGHLVRSLALAGALAERFRVVFLSGGRLPERMTVPGGVELVALPPLGMREGGSLASLGDEPDVDVVLARRRRMILQAFARVKPAVVLIELFPFGRNKFAPEIMPLLEAVQELGDTRPIVATSVRDILVRGRSTQQAHDDRAAQRANRYLDCVLVHGDPRFARLDETFQPTLPLRIPVHHTGFVVPIASDRAAERHAGRVVVSAGGGLVGEDLLRTAIQAHRIRGRAAGWEMTVIGGPFLPNDAWERLRSSSAGMHGLRLVRAVDDLVAELRGSAVSVSQCGYNTSLDLIRARVPALVVPFVAPGEDEQVLRAYRLERFGVARVLHPQDVSPERLANDISTLAGAEPPDTMLDLDGGRRSTEILAAMAGLRARDGLPTAAGGIA